MTDNKPTRRWAKHMQRRTNTSYRLTLELSGARLFARPLGRVVRPPRKTAGYKPVGGKPDDCTPSEAEGVG